MDPCSLSYLSAANWTSTQTWQLVAIIILVMLSAFFSASETAFSTVSRIRLHTLEGNGVKWAKRAGKMIDRYDRLITTVLIGNNIVNIVLSSLATLFFVSVMTTSQDVAVTVSTAVTTVTVLIFGEITPKTLAKEHPEGLVRAFCNIVFALEILFFPFTWLFSQWRKLLVKIFKFKKSPGITEDELLTYVETAHSEGGIDEHESELIRSAIEFEDLDIGDIMVHRVGVVAVPDDATMDEVAKAFRDNGYSRIPVYSGTIDTVIGTIHEKDFLMAFLDGASDFKKCIQKTVCLSANMKISAALRMMQKSKIHMAVVVDEYGGTAGLITLEDLVESIVGNIQDEYDNEAEEIHRVSETEFTVDGTASIDEISDLTEVELPEGNYDTIGGLVTELLGYIPKEGEQPQVEIAGLSIKVLGVEDRRLSRLLIIKLPPKDEDGEKEDE